MDLNQLIFDRLTTDERIAGVLAKYAGTPAVFNTEFPSDQSEGWEGMEQYPRISYSYDTQADPKRSSSGTLRIAVYTTRDMGKADEIEEMVRDRLKNVIMKPEEEAPFCVSWARTDPFEIEGTNILFKDISFDILDFPEQISTTPDPALSMNLFLKSYMSNAFLVSYDDMGNTYEPTDEDPAIYVRIVSLSKMQETYALVFVNVQLAIHVIAPTAEGRLKTVRILYDELFKRGEIDTEDGHGIMIEDIQADAGADYLAAGQITVRGMYVMTSARVRSVPEIDKLRHVYMDFQGGE